jgi:hypothetical protein
MNGLALVIYLENILAVWKKRAISSRLNERIATVHVLDLGMLQTLQKKTSLPGTIGEQ